MVLPLIPVVLGVSALATAVAGLKKSYDARGNFLSAQATSAEALQGWIAAADALEKRREEVGYQLTTLGHVRLRVASQSLSRFVSLVEQISYANVADIPMKGYSVPIEIVPLNESRELSYKATDYLKHGAQSAVSGVMVGAGVGQAVTMFGSASTGAAISGLSGAAATNATLAWLGGGSIASGGLGMAGGTAVLGGVVAGPILLVMGYLAAGKSEEALTKAAEYAAKAQVAVEQLAQAGLALDAIEGRAREVEWVLEALDERFQAVASRVARFVGRERRELQAEFLDAGLPVPTEIAGAKIEYSALSATDKASYQKLLILGSALYQVAKLAIMDEAGDVTARSEQMVDDMRQILEEV